MVGQHVLEVPVGHVLHHHPGVALVVLADVVEVQQVGVFQVEALADAAEFDVEVAADQLQRDVLAGVAGGVIDFAEAALADAPLDRIAGQGAGAAGIHESPRRPAQRRRRAGRRVGRWGDRVVAVWRHGSHLFLHRTLTPYCTGPDAGIMVVGSEARMTDDEMPSPTPNRPNAWISTRQSSHRALIPAGYFFATLAVAGVLAAKCSVTCSTMFSGVALSTGISSW